MDGKHTIFALYQRGGWKGQDVQTSNFALVHRAEKSNSVEKKNSERQEKGGSEG